MKIAIGNDHRGVALKKKIIKKFKNLTFYDFGTDSSERVDYPDYASSVAQRVSSGECDRGILICSTGVGMSISANKFPGVRAAMIWDPQIARLTRLHNDSNVLCLGGDFTDEEKAFEIVDTWLKTKFEGGRYQRRVDKIKKQEKEASQGCLNKKK